VAGPRLRALIGPLAALTLAVAGAAPTVAAAEPNPVAVSEATEGERLLRQGTAAAHARSEYARDMGALVAPTPDGRSFYVAWSPRGPDDLSSVPVIVTLHGSRSWAFDEFFLWHPDAEKRGYGVIALQWWLGRGDAAGDYYTPHEMHAMLSTLMRWHGVRPHRALLHGFSRGAANTYPLAWLDVRDGHRFFELIVPNAGGASQDYPPIAAISSHRYGENVFADTHWVLFCGQHDPHADRDGCIAMRRTKSWIESFRGTVEEVIEDPEGGHGAFHKNPEHVMETLKVFDRLLEAGEAAQRP
jgi:hypothetical protein